MSPRREAELEKRREVVQAVHDRDRVCRADALVAVASVPHSGALVVHELVSRAQWAKGYLRVDNCVLLCTAHHQYVHGHPYLAHCFGLLKWSHERGT
jgi:hypothetical protein